MPDPRPVRAGAARVRRYAEIGTIAVRSGLVRHWATGSVTSQVALGRSLRAACERAGGVYVKLGQLLSTRPDLVSSGVAAELRLLQNAVAPAPARLVTRVVAEELGARPDRMFMDFDDRPIPAASIAQVLARALLGCFLDQLFVVGTFHVDPHPGNLYLTGDGDIALLDCGAIGRLDLRQRMALQAVLVAVAARDGAALGDALAAISVTAGGKDRDRLDASLDHLLDRHLPPGASPDAALFGAFMGVMRELGLALEPVVYGALRAVATLQATLGALAPDLDLLTEATSYGYEPAAA